MKKTAYKKRNKELIPIRKEERESGGGARIQLMRIFKVRYKLDVHFC